MNLLKIRIGLWLLIEGWLAFPLAAQVPLQILQTGTGLVLVSTNQTLSIPSARPDQELDFDFGFSTNEEIVPGQFLDAITFSLAALLNNATSIVIYATADRSGVNWAPPSPGATFIRPETILSTAINFPSLAPVFSNQLAYHVRAPLPPGWPGGRATFYFDLFDNQNPVGSLGWVSRVDVIPEPRLAILLLLAVASLLIPKRSAH